MFHCPTVAALLPDLLSEQVPRRSRTRVFQNSQAAALECLQLRAIVLEDPDRPTAFWAESMLSWSEQPGAWRIQAEKAKRKIEFSLARLLWNIRIGSADEQAAPIAECNTASVGAVGAILSSITVYGKHRSKFQ